MSALTLGLSVTLTGSRETVKAKVDRILAVLDGDGMVALQAGTGTSGPAAMDDGVSAFVQSLPPSCRQAVSVVAMRSALGERVGRAELQAAVTIDGHPISDENRLDGVTGTIGRNWRKYVGTPNPFKARRAPESGELSCGVNVDLANRLLTALASTEV